MVLEFSIFDKMNLRCFNVPVEPHRIFYLTNMNKISYFVIRKLMKSIIEFITEIFFTKGV